VQTLENNQATLPSTITVHFATAQLKGTIYYNSYDTSLVTAGAPNGATLAIQVGASAPTVVDGNTACRECHTVSASGNVLLANNGTITSPNIYESELSVALPAATETTIPSAGAPVLNDGRFSWAAVSPDGTMMFTNAGSNQGGSMSGQWNNTSTPYYSGLYSVSTGAALATSNLSASLQVLFPTFATDMAADGLPHGLAFNYNSADGLSLATMNVTWNTPVAAKWNFSTPTVLFTPPKPTTLGVTGDGAAVWPSYMPAGQNGIVVQNQAYFGCVEPGADGASIRAGSGGTTDLERNMGALGELWWVNTSGTALPARLNQANGLGYLPTGPNGHGAAGTTVPSVSANPSDTAGGMPTTLTGTTCGGAACSNCKIDLWNAVGPNGNDALENFKPTVNPQTTGGYQWVVFMSRRMYGNIGVINPYASDPREANEIDVGATPRYPSPKKLWVAAINTTPGAGSDPSYPAFYLDGQELYAGNSRGYWVLPQCIVPSATRSAATVCTSSQDCCATGPGTPAACTLDIPIASNPPTKHCVPTTAIMCSADGASCNVDGDCCNLISEGTRCSGGICQIPPPSGYPATESVSYDFQGTCSGGVVIGDASQGQSPVWQYIQTDQIVPAGTSIGITLQTAPTEAGLATAVSATPYSLTATTTAPMYLSSPLIPMGAGFVAQPVDQYLRALSPPQASQLWLRVTVTLNASPTLQSAPTLQSLLPTFDCLATE